VLHKTFKVFRGAALGISAIEEFKRLKVKGEEFLFNGFASTTVVEVIARRFAKKNSSPDKLPCLLILEVLDNGKNKAFLHSTAYTPFPEEKELLLGHAEWVVDDVYEEEAES